MNALLRKELRQILPAQLFLTALVTAAWFGLVDAKVALAPYADVQLGQQSMIAVFCLLEGLVLGLGQFGSEQWSDTQAYLVHRGTGHRRAFHAKVLAGLIGLAPLAVVPPLAFAAVHVLGGEFSGSAAVFNVVRMTGAGSVVVLGYAVGVLAAQLQRGWLMRIGLALLAGLTALLLLTLLYVPRAVLGEHPLARLLLALGLVSALLLALARTDFEQTLHPGRARGAALARAVCLSALCLPLLATIPFGMVFTQSFSTEGPHIVQDGEERLYLATRTDLDREELVRGREGLSPYGDVYALEDEAGRPVEGTAALRYRGFSGWFWSREEEQHPELPVYHTLFARGVTPLTPLSEANPIEAMEQAEPFSWSGPWVRLRNVGWGWQCALDLSTGSLWGRDDRRTRPRWVELGSAGTPVRVVELGSMGSRPVLCEREGARLWSITQPDKQSAPTLRPAPLPEGERLVGIEPLLTRLGVLCGLRQEAGGEVVRGERAAYAWVDEAWVPWRELTEEQRNGAALAEEAPELQRWSLVASTERGSLQRVEARDVRTGEVRIAVELPPAPLAAELWCLALPPAATWISWARPERAAPDPRINRIGPTHVDLVRGRNRTWIPALLLVVAALLTRDLWRRLAHGGAPLELRLWWCGATLCLGLPAYLLARIVEPRSARRPQREATDAQPEPRLVIRTV